MPAHRVVSIQQLEMLVAFMEENRDLAVGTRPTDGPHDKQRVKSRWEALATRLNAVGVGATKSGGKWRDYWNERKYAVRKRAHYRIQHAQDTGDGLTMAGPWTAMDEKILGILGKETVFGLDYQGETVQKAPSGVSEPKILSPNIEVNVRRISPSRQDSKTKRIIYRRRVEAVPSAGALQLEERKLAVEKRTVRAVERLLEEVAGIKAAMERRQPDHDFDDSSVRYDKELQQNDESQNISQKREHKTSEKNNTWPTDEFDFFGCSMAIQLKKLPELEALGVMQRMLFMMTDIKKKLIEENDKKKLKYSHCNQSNPLKRPTPTSPDHDMMTDKDEFDFFGCSMAIQLKNLPELEALRVMQKMLSMVTDTKRKLKENNYKKKLKHSHSYRSDPLKRPKPTTTLEVSSDSITDTFEQDTGQKELNLTEQDMKQKEQGLTEQENFLNALEEEHDASEYPLVVLRT